MCGCEKTCVSSTCLVPVSPELHPVTDGVEKLLLGNREGSGSKVGCVFLGSP